MWIDENFGGLGPTIMILYPEGRGAYDIWNVSYAGRDDFRWELMEDGTQLRVSEFSGGANRTFTYNISFHWQENQKVLRLNQVAYYLSATSVDDYVQPEEE